MSTLLAIVPISTLKRWDRVAAAQLCADAARLAEENEVLRTRLSWAEGAAEHWQQNAMDLAGDNAGLTIDGALVRLAPFDGRPFAETGGGHRTDSDVQFAVKVADTSTKGPLFLVSGNRITLLDLLRDNADDDQVCDWARTAQLGHRLPASLERGQNSRFVQCERVS